MRDSVMSNLVHAVLLAVSFIAATAVFPSNSHAVTFNNISSGRPTPTSAPVTSISVAATTPTATVIAGTDGGGTYSMNVGGTSWSQATTGMTNRQVQAVVVHPADPAITYAGTKAGVFRKASDETTWSLVNTGLANTDVRALAINSTALFAGTAGGIYKSSDGGSTWTPFNDAGLTSNDIRALLISGSYIFAGTSDGIFRSPTASAGWGDHALSATTITSLTAGSANSLFAGCLPGGVYSSVDGVNWNADSTGLANLFVYSLAADSSGSPVYAGTAGGVFKKTGSPGDSWISISNGITAPNIIRSLATASGNRLYAGTTLGTFASTNGGSSWIALNSGLIAGRAIAISPTNPTVVTGGFSAGGAYSTSDRGGNWTASVSGLANVFVNAVAYDPVTPGLVYAATGSGAFSSSDNGQNWTNITGNLSSTAVRALAIPASGSPPLHAGTAAGVYTWDGTNWSNYAGGQPGDLKVTSLAFNGTTLLAGTNGGSIYRSIGGAAWTQLLTGLSSTVISSLAVDSSGGYLYAGTNAGVHKSTTASNGDSWTRIANNTTDDIRSLAVNLTTPPAPASPLTVLVAGTPAGAFATTDAGATWAAVPYKAADSLINGVALDADWPQHLHAATGRGLATTQLTPTLSVTPATGYLINPAYINNSKIQQYTLSNTGTIDLTVRAYSIAHTLPDPPTLTTGGTTPCTTLPTLGTPLILRPGQSCTLQFTFTPAVSGISNATVTFTSNDIAFPSRALVLNWNADDPPPNSVIASPVNNESVKTPKQVVGVASDIGSGVQSVLLSFDGQLSWTPATQTVPGSWASWQYNWAPISEGVYAIVAKAVDNNGNEQSPLPPLTVYVDNTPPASTISSPANNSAIKGTTQVISGTAADSVTAGAGSGLQKVEVSTDGGITWLDATGTTAWTFNWTIPSDGLYDILARATDKAGNRANSTNTNQVRVDNTAPTGVAINTPTAGQTLPFGTSYTIMGTASDAGSGIATVDVSTDNGITWLTANYSIADNSWSYTWTLPVNGAYQVLARAVDYAGNVTTTAPRSVVVNNPLPTSIITSPIPGTQLHGATVSITLTAQVTIPGLSLSMVEVSLGGGAWQQASCLLVSAPGATPADYMCSYNPALPQNFFNAAYSLRSRAVDAVGNLQAPSYDIIVLLDNKLPTSTITLPTNGAYLQMKQHTVTGTATDFEPLQGVGVQQVQISFDNGLNWAPAVGSASWSADWTPSGDGIFTILTRSVDQTGNTQNPITSITVYVDSVLPTASFTSTPHNPSNSHDPSFTVIADEPANFSCTLKNTGTNTILSSGFCGCTPNASTYTSSCTVTYSIADAGTYAVMVTPTDRAGNVGAQIISPWVVDFTPVTVLSVSPSDNARLVTTSSSIRVVFNKDIDPATVGTNSFQLNNGITGTVAYDVATQTATFTPNPRPGKKPLDYGTYYTATLTPAIRDAAGNSLQGAPISWSFTTDPDGDINGDGQVNITDALLALYLTVERVSFAEVAALRPTGSQNKESVLGHGDVGPLLAGRPNPDGSIDIRDALVILRKYIGLENW